MRLKALEVEEQVDRALETCFTTKVRNINRTQARAASAKVAAKPAAAAAAPAKPVVTATPAKPVAAAPA